MSAVVENVESGFYVNITPTWEAAVRIYLAVLDNPKAAAVGRRAAHDEILRLARIVDHLSAEREAMQDV